MSEQLPSILNGCVFGNYRHVLVTYPVDNRIVKNNKKDSKTTLIDVILVSLLLTLKDIGQLGYHSAICLKCKIKHAIENNYLNLISNIGEPT